MESAESSEESSVGRSILLTGHDLLRLERGETIEIDGITIKIDHSSP
jgi:hypothetical protein